MDDSHNSLRRIGDEDRHAVRGLDSQEQAGSICDGSVAAAHFSGGRLECVNDVGMRLAQGHEVELVRAQRFEESFPVGQYTFARIPFSKAEVEYFLALEMAFTAPAGAEAVNQPTMSLKVIWMKRTLALRTSDHGSLPFWETLRERYRDFRVVFGIGRLHQYNRGR